MRSKPIVLLPIFASLCISVHFAGAATLYVNANNSNSVPPYSNWTTAATNIQNAIDAADSGDLVLVTNGVYASGGRVAIGTLTNRVAVTKPITVQSVNGPAVTWIQGYQVPVSTNGPEAVRCVYLTNGAALFGFTLTNGATFDGDFSTDYTGGGLWCESPSALVSNCIVSGNAAYYLGGGAFSGTLKNCLVFTNMARQGGGVWASVAYNCLFRGNAARFGGGAGSATLYSCTLAGNWGVIRGSGSGLGGGAFQSTLYNSIVYFNVTTGSSTSDCYSCALNYCCSTPGGGSPIITDDPLFVDEPAGDLHLQSNSPCINAGNNSYVPSGPDLDGNARISGGTVDMGAYEVQSATGNFVTHYVNLLSTNPTPPYTNWATAATSIQDAMDAANQDDHVIVTNGIYNTGGGAVSGSLLTNRVAVTKRITVESVNGPRVTTIQGYQVPVTTNGDGAIRCVYLSYGAKLAGFTLTNGGTLTSGDGIKEQSGGGIWCETTASVSNCIIAGNSAASDGGGAYQGALDHCIVANNSVSGVGGGMCHGSAVNCILFANNAHWGGGGAIGATLDSCTVISNWAFSPGPLGPMNVFPGGGVSGGSVRNSIIYYNYANVNANCDNALVNYCCTTPDPGGTGNITSEPLFVDQSGANLRLQTNSPCINAGDPGFALGGTDLDGRPRVIAGRLDVGAYEFQSASLSLFNQWLQQYGLATDGSADFADSDGDSMNNWQEWLAGTVPTESASVLRLLDPLVNLPNVTIRWQSVTNRTYTVQRAAYLATSAFSTVATNIPGQAAMTTFTDTNTASGSFFYRVAVE